LLCRSISRLCGALQRGNRLVVVTVDTQRLFKQHAVEHYRAPGSAGHRRCAHAAITACPATPPPAYTGAIGTSSNAFCLACTAARLPCGSTRQPLVTAMTCVDPMYRIFMPGLVPERVLRITTPSTYITAFALFASLTHFLHTPSTTGLPLLVGWCVRATVC